MAKRRGRNREEAKHDVDCQKAIPTACDLIRFGRRVQSFHKKLFVRERFVSRDARPNHGGLPNRYTLASTPTNLSTEACEKMSDWSRAVSVAEIAARAGAEVLRSWAGRVQAQEKGPADLVTQADIESQEAIKRLLVSEFPHCGFWGEESERPADLTGQLWVVDPLDGTTNYVHGVPQYCVSVGLLCDGTPVAGCIYDPLLDECFTAGIGLGAALNGAPLAVSQTKHLGQALMAATFAARVGPQSPEVGPFLGVLFEARAVRRTGSAALNLAYLAAGRFDGYWSLATQSWDVAAGLVLVAEAGGVVTGYETNSVDLAQPRFIAAATHELHSELRAALAEGAKNFQSTAWPR